jgi:hypothetical protein
LRKFCGKENNEDGDNVVCEMNRFKYLISVVRKNGGFEDDSEIGLCVDR